MGCSSLGSLCSFMSMPSKFPKFNNSRSRIHSIAKSANMDLNLKDCNNNSTTKHPVFLFDVMDTIVRDPFYQDIPAFFGMSMSELLNEKHPTAWSEFEKGLITEDEFEKKFFKDGRPFDYNGLKQCVNKGYTFLDGMERLLNKLKSNGYEIHAFTNYPCWYLMIEEKLKLSRYMSWSFASCNLGKQKPDEEVYLEVIEHLTLPPSCCIFIDDSHKLCLSHEHNDSESGECTDVALLVDIGVIERSNIDDDWIVGRQSI